MRTIDGATNPRTNDCKLRQRPYTDIECSGLVKLKFAILMKPPTRLPGLTGSAFHPRNSIRLHTQCSLSPSLPSLNSQATLILAIPTHSRSVRTLIHHEP